MRPALSTVQCRLCVKLCRIPQTGRRRPESSACVPVPRAVTMSSFAGFESTQTGHSRSSMLNVINPCNFTSTEVNNTHVELKITHVKPEDSGRYYCGEHLASYLQFNGIGVALQVGDVNSSTTKVHILKESKDGEPYMDKSNISSDISEGMVPDRPYEMEDSVWNWAAGTLQT
ncbi:hypothetical protein AGOR_G00208450 [Albula goreensis]|uniref:Uncharacterized protein n=1 Tax=Albula goreensis TaxID=1534307 RepID=A0A8T3CLC3_9TELE|nr:hypothetical protein AGOR_G00208450 [Albula goreensis]